MSVASIRSEGDLEVVVLHEAHSALAEIISPGLYSVSGTPPDQSVVFHMDACFNLFLILSVEFFADGPRSAFINQKYQNWSLLKGLRWFCTVHQDEAIVSGLEVALSELESWIAKVVPFRFWCPDVNTEIEFLLRNEQLISFGANTAKHHLLRLAELLGKLDNLCVNAGYTFSPQELSAVLEPMISEIRSRLHYHSSYLIELLGNVFLGLNNVVIARFAANPTNRVTDMTMPPDITSDVFRDLYGSILVFKRYEYHRTRVYTPVTTRFLKLRYQD